MVSLLSRTNMNLGYLYYLFENEDGEDMIVTSPNGAVLVHSEPFSIKSPFPRKENSMGRLYTID